MATFKVTQVESVEAEDILNETSDFKTLANIEFTEPNSNILLLKKMIIELGNRVATLEKQIAKTGK
jgi:hypothetical protein